MARYPANHKEKTRRRILGAAERVFRSKGYVAGGIGDVMGAAALTKGGFYAHFRSKEHLFNESLGQMFSRQERRLRAILGDRSGIARVERALAVYLNPEHLDRDASACPLACLLSEFRRTEAESRQIMEQFHDHLVSMFQTHLAVDGVDSGHAAILADGLVSLAVGAVTTARVCECRDRAARILLDARTIAGGILEANRPR